MGLPCRLGISRFAAVIKHFPLAKFVRSKWMLKYIFATHFIADILGSAIRAMSSLYRLALALACKPNQKGLLFVHDNCDLGAVL